MIIYTCCWLGDVYLVGLTCSVDGVINIFYRVKLDDLESRIDRLPPILLYHSTVYIVYYIYTSTALVVSICIIHVCTYCYTYSIYTSKDTLGIFTTFSSYNNALGTLNSRGRSILVRVYKYYKL